MNRIPWCEALDGRHSLAIAVMTAKGEQAESMDIATGTIQTWLTVDNLKSGFKALAPYGNWVAVVVSESKQDTTI